MMVKSALSIWFATSVHGGVERPRQEQENERDARGDQGQPHQERRPGLAPAAEGAP